MVWPTGKPVKHVLVIALDEDLKLVGYEARKDGVVKAREHLSSMSVGGAKVPPMKEEHGLADHPGPHNNADKPANSVHADVQKGSDRKRAHLTFRVTGNDPCFQVGSDLICY
jgi:hypothetical protein